MDLTRRELLLAAAAVQAAVTAGDRSRADRSIAAVLANFARDHYRDSRIEQDFLGTREIGDDVYYGVQTIRGKENFHITGIAMNQEPFFVKALGYVKKAAAMANRDLGALDAKIADAIVVGCDRVIAGDMMDQFVTDFIQGGAGTSTNMNANEVIANLALESLGFRKGDYHEVSPNDHVNYGQSTNDTYPTAFRLALILRLDSYITALRQLQDAFFAKAREFDGVLKMGRTHLQDATPLTLGQEISGWVAQLDHAIRHLEAVLPHLQELALGGTAVGTGLNAPPEFGARVAMKLAEMTGLPFRRHPNAFAALAANDELVFAQGALATLAAALMKIANDIRWLASGPRCGLGELSIPENEPGSSIMPGKVNPTQAEALAMACAQVQGNDVAVGIGGAAGAFELNVYKPLLIHNFLGSARLLAEGMASFEAHCARGIAPNEARLRELTERSLMLVTALAPHIGYDRAAEIAKKAHRDGSTLRAAALALGYVSAEQFDAWVRPERMTGA